MLYRHRTVTHLGDERPVLLEERLVASAVRVGALEGAVRTLDFDQTVGPAGEQVARVLIEDRLLGPPRRLHVGLTAVRALQDGRAVLPGGEQGAVVGHFGDRDVAGDAGEPAGAVRVLLFDGSVRVGLDEAAVI